MNGEALGLIETVGMAAAIEAADVCVKSANVKLIGYELSRGLGMVTVKIKGDVGAVKAAIEAAKISASKVNKVYTSLVIPRPAKGIDSIIESKLTVGLDDKEKKIKQARNASDKSDVDNNVLGNELKQDEAERNQDKIKETEKSKEKKQGGKEEQAAEINLNTSNIEQSQVVENVKSKSKEHDEAYENKLETVNSHEKNEVVSQSKKSVENNEDVCNICHDPTCHRRKGQPRNLCKHYKKS